MDLTLIVISGDSCSERCRYDLSPRFLHPAFAVGDVQEGGTLEIAFAYHKAILPDVLLFDSECNLLWEADPNCGAPELSIANLDGEGDPEVICSAAAIDSSGEILWDAGADDPALVADVDLDGELEVVTATRILDGATGIEEAVFAGLESGPTAVADFDRSTPEPEIVGPAARIHTIDGDMVFGPAGGLASTTFVPSVADFDADGFAEIAVGGNAMVVDPDCDPSWARGGDCASGREDGILWDRVPLPSTEGLTAFDLDADGGMEVVTAEECFVKILDGLTGETRWSASNTSSFENLHALLPIVADTDGDGHAEVVVAADDETYTEGLCPAADPETGAPFEGPHAGIRVFRDPLDRWPATRPIWNQNAYAVTNVDDDGSIPRDPERNWEVGGLNDFRRNPGPELLGRGIDLTVRAEAPLDRCPGSMTLRAVVANRGTVRAPPGIRVDFTLDDLLEAGGTPACDARTLDWLEPGSVETVSCDWIAPGAEPRDVHIRVDPRDFQIECEERNNEAFLPGVACDVAG